MQNTSKQYELAELVTVPEAARYLGVGRKIIYQLIEFDQLRAIRQRGKIFIDPSSIEDFYNSGKRI